MRQIVYDGYVRDSRTRHPREACVTVNRKNGRIAVNKAAMEMIGKPVSVVLIQDADHPADWYILPREGGYILSLQPDKSSSSTFYDKLLAGRIHESVGSKETSIRMVLSRTRDEESGWPLCWSRFGTKEGGAL